MILHPDGRVEGTPEEVAAYKQRDILREQANACRKRLLEDKDYQKELEQSGIRTLKANEGHIQQVRRADESDQWAGFDARFKDLGKPPLGLIPRHIREQQRLEEIKEAIARTKTSGYPPEWREEADDLRKSIAAYYEKADLLHMMPAN